MNPSSAAYNLKWKTKTFPPTKYFSERWTEMWALPQEAGWQGEFSPAILGLQLDKIGVMSGKYSHGWQNTLHMLNCKINGTVHIFFLEKSYLSPRWHKLRDFFPSWSLPVIFRCHNWFWSHFGPLHGPNWKHVPKKCLFGCPRPKSLKMTKIVTKINYDI